MKTLYDTVWKKYGKKPKQILFNTEMVRAILNERKTQTRRPIKSPTGKFIAVGDKPNNRFVEYVYETISKKAKPPYQPGDILYVRETWRIGAWNEHIQAIAVDYFADNCIRREWIYIEDEERFEKYWIQSTEDAEKAGIQVGEDEMYHWEPGEAPTRWRPSIHMPKEVARIFLKVADVWIERVQDITYENAIAEGIKETDIYNDMLEHCSAVGLGTGGIPEQAFAELWDNLYQFKGYSWDDNPWVWVIEFEKINGEDG